MTNVTEKIPQNIEEVKKLLEYDQRVKVAGTFQTIN
jgi:hypothetical protein